MPLFAIGMPGPWELGLVLVIIMMFFGLGKLPQVFETFGKGLKAFKDAQKDDPVDVTPPRKSLAEGEVSDADELKARDRAEAKRQR